LGFYFSQIHMKNNIKHISWTWFVIGLIFLGIVYYFINMYTQQSNKIPQVCSLRKCFTVELARTPAQQELGLMNRTSMAENSGMLFIFSKNDFYNFWMKNTRIPLDMIRIDEQYTVVRILTAQPCITDPCMVYRPEKIALFVLEINAWIAAKWGIQEGMNVKFRNIE